MRHTHTREMAVAAAIAALAIALAVVAPGYFSAENLRDLFLANLPVLLVAIGMTLVIVAGEIDISVGSVFAICAVAAGVLAKAGMPVWLASAAASRRSSSRSRRWSRRETGCAGRRKGPGFRTCRGRFSGSGSPRLNIRSSP